MAADRDWALGFLEQARADLAAVRVLSSRNAFTTEQASVLAMLRQMAFEKFAKAALLRSGLLATWALLFLAGNFVVIPVVEEPMLRQRFGAPYEEYCRNVGRLVPRFTPWTPRDG